jgi:subtilase family serine protease
MYRGYFGLGLMIALIMAAFDIAAAEPLVTHTIDDSQLVTLDGNTRPEVRRAEDIGPLAAGFVLDHMQLQLRRSPGQEQAVEQFVKNLQDVSSPNYHHWLSAEEFGARFGADVADIQAVTGWLKRHGFTIEGISAGRMMIDFTGNAAQVAEAFHAQVHRLVVDGHLHIANISDPAVPAALAPVITGVTSLHDFRPHANHLAARPHFTSSSGCDGPCYSMAPADLQKIYNITPLYASGISGAGQTIAVVGDSDLYKTADFTDFRKVFGLAARYPTGKLIVTHPAPPSGSNNCSDPGVNKNGDDWESTIDTEWASAAAPGATIELASCNNTATSDGVFFAAQNLVNAKTHPLIISISYGNCEAENGAAYNASFNTLYQQAVAEGISVFVATGDNGPSDCASGGKDTTYGIGINAWAATQYNVAVGGTDFSDTYSRANPQYWNASSSAATDWGSARSYIPEFAWDDTCASTYLAKYTSGSATTFGAAGFCNTKAGHAYLPLGGGEGGPSGCFTGAPTTAGVVSGTCKGYPKPSWQRGAFGNPADAVRDVPDIAIFAADGIWRHDYLLCFSDPNNGGGLCTGNPGNWPAGGGGTSFATPIVAGIQGLVNQRMKARQGNPNPVYYKLAAMEYGSVGNPACNASRGASVGSSCVFHDVTAGDTSQPCLRPFDCYHPSGVYGVLSRSDSANVVAYEAHSGWDFASGIGTVNAANLVTKWGSVAP